MATMHPAAVNASDDVRDDDTLENSVGGTTTFKAGSQSYEHMILVAKLLYLASHGKTKDFAEEVKDHPELINCKDYDERTPLHLASSEGKVRMVTWLIENGAQLNVVDRWRGTPLSDALRAGKTEVVDILVKSGGLMMGVDGTLITFEEEALTRSMKSNDWEIDNNELGVDDTTHGGSRVGTGSFGTVHRATWRGTEVAIKRLHDKMVQDDRALALFRMEMAIMCSVAHPNVVQFLGACTTSRPLSIVTEFLPNGSLADVFKTVKMTAKGIPHDKAISWAVGTAKGMAYLHGRRPTSIIHRDLKPANLLLDTDERIKVTDFGLSKTISEKKDAKLNETYKMTGGTGSFLYMAPEVFRHENYDNKVDVYSFGMIMFQLFEHVVPFSREHGPTLDYIKCAQRASNGERPELNGPSPAVNDIISKCWAADPAERPNFTEIVHLLEEYRKTPMAVMLSEPREKEAQGQCGCSVM
mmetsp:Transcript_32511/g.103516  ORF Transcript_32511/g.103516 Transcript_32511/m.103516 type:complete len:470 (+) Transcript_32511:33-1442(+)